MLLLWSRFYVILIQSIIDLLSIIVPTLEGALKELSDDEFKAKYGRDKPKEDQEVVFHCKMGGRAGRAAESAKNLGFKNVKNYKGSFNDWLEKEGK